MVSYLIDPRKPPIERHIIQQGGDFCRTPGRMEYYLFRSKSDSLIAMVGGDERVREGAVRVA